MGDPAAAAGTVRIEAEAMRRLVAGILEADGVPAEDAATIAECLVEADLRGVDTHGAVRLPGYRKRLGLGLINPRPALAFRQPTPVVASLDADNGFGFVVARRAMDKAIEIAGTFGIGLVSVHRSTHFGMAASYVRQAMRRGLIGILLSNASPAMPPWGGRGPVFGTNPLAFGIPGGGIGAGQGDFLLDMSPCVAARGKIRRALRRGEPIPPGFALDAAGRPTTDPAAALEGVLLPIGGYKGSGLSMLMDVLCGVLSGAAFGGEVGDQYRNFERPQDVGHLVMALKADLFLPEAEVQRRMQALTRRVHETPRADGVDEILMPGEPEARHEAERLAHGIPYARADLRPLLERAAEIGLGAPAMRPA